METVVCSDYKASSQNHELQYKYSLDFFRHHDRPFCLSGKMNLIPIFIRVFLILVLETRSIRVIRLQAPYTAAMVSWPTNWKPLRNLDLIIAGRITHTIHNLDGFILADFNPSYHWPFHHFGSISSGITAPSIYQLYSQKIILRHFYKAIRI